MIFLEIVKIPTSAMSVMLFGTIGMLILAIGLIVFIVLHQRRVILYQMTLQKMEEEQQTRLLNASIRSQEEERQRLAADLHDDAGPLLATARLYLNENLIHLEKSIQIQHITAAKSVIDDTIHLIRNISHSLMPPTLKNFGLESALNDLFQKISGSGNFNASCRFHDYRHRLKLEHEQIAFRILQELVNNILKHSNASFINVTQNTNGSKLYIRLHHDGTGLTQPEFDRLVTSSGGLGLKNIQSRLKVLDGKIQFEKDIPESYFKVTIELPKEEEIITQEKVSV
jgi:two-component system NarL family sensor kinase